MNKINLRTSWLWLIIPLGIFIFVIVPELQKMYHSHEKATIIYEQKKEDLLNLQQTINPDKRQQKQIEQLERSVAITHKNLLKQKYLYLKIGSIIAILIFMGLGAMISRFLEQRNYRNRPQTSINFEDFSNDIVGHQISWDAIQTSGSNFLSERLKKIRIGYKISGTTFTKIFAWSFFLIGIVYTIISFIEFHQFSKEPISFMIGGKLFFTSGGIFTLVGIFLLFAFSAKAILHLQKQKIIVDGQMISFKEAYALQVLKKFIQNNSSGSYFSYELNLVTQNGTRHNLLSHGSKEVLLYDTASLQRILKIPVWDISQ